MADIEIVVHADIQAVAQNGAERVVAAADRAIADRGAFAIALAGGSTPAAFYQVLASSEYSGRVDWTRAQIFFGDERCVPPDHEWSNYAMAKRALLGRVPLLGENVHRIHGELPAHDAAAAYAKRLRQFLPLSGLVFPRFDLILLGMGDDGHTASLFPGMPALAERDAWVINTPVPDYVRPQVARVTLTLPVLNSARQVLFLVTGEAKAERVRTVLLDAKHDPDAAALPAADISPYAGDVTWLLDRPAAFLLKGK